MKALLSGNSTLTALLGTFQGGVIPLIEGGVLAEQEIDLPAIVFVPEPATKEAFLGDYRFLVNIYAETSRESYLVANTLVDQFNEKQNPINGYFTQTTCNILTQVANPTAKEVNTPVEFRLINM